MNDKIMEGKCLCGSVSIQAKTNKDTEQIFIDKKACLLRFFKQNKNAY